MKFEVPSTQAELQEAFSLFNQVSEQLTGAYAELQLQVSQLTNELSIANGELRKQYEEKAALSERLELLLSALPGGVVVIDAMGLVVEANPAAKALLGNALLGSAWEQVVADRLVATPMQGEWRLQDKRLSISRSQLNVSNGDILLIQDISEAYLLREQFQRQRRLLSMGEMVAGLAHQLRTPLATALLYTSHLRGELSAEDRVRFADKAIGRLKSLEHLIQDMLIFVRGGQSATAPVSITALLHDIEQVMEPQFVNSSLRFDIEDASEGASVLGSREALAGALQNLIANAMQASESGGQISLKAINLDRKVVEIHVSDQGKGMPQSVQDCLFQPFFTTRTEGTGLGLAIVREVTQMHGGEISVKSKPGEGSTFTLRLPVI